MKYGKHTYTTLEGNMHGAVGKVRHASDLAPFEPSFPPPFFLNTTFYTLADTNSILLIRNFNMCFPAFSFHT